MIYQSKGSGNLDYSEFGHGPVVVLNLKTSLAANESFLAEYLGKQGHGIMGTTKASMLQQCPMPSMSDMKKQPWGTYTFFHHEEKDSMQLAR